MNRDEGSYQLSHAYDSLLDATADRRIKTRRTEYQLLLMKISWWDRKRQNKVLKFWLWYMNFLLVSIHQPNECISGKVSWSRCHLSLANNSTKLLSKQPNCRGRWLRSTTINATNNRTCISVFSLIWLIMVSVLYLYFMRYFTCIFFFVVALICRQFYFSFSFDFDDTFVQRM